MNLVQITTDLSRFDGGGSFQKFLQMDGASRSVNAG